MKLSPMTENYTMGIGRMAGEKDPEQNASPMSNMESNIVEGMGMGAVHTQSDKMNIGGKLPGMGK